MASPAKGTPRKQAKGEVSLSEQAHQQEMDFLKLGNESPYPEIRAAAIERAKEAAKFRRKQEARVSPNLILGVILAGGIAALAECWYALVNYSGRLAGEVCALAISIYLLILGATLFLAGHLSEAGFMKIVDLLTSYVKAKWNSAKRSSRKDASHDGPAEPEEESGK